MFLLKPLCILGFPWLSRPQPAQPPQPAVVPSDAVHIGSQVLQENVLLGADKQWNGRGIGLLLSIVESPVLRQLESKQLWLSLLRCKQWNWKITSNKFKLNVKLLFCEARQLVTFHCQKGRQTNITIFPKLRHYVPKSTHQLSLAKLAFFFDKRDFFSDWMYPTAVSTWICVRMP